MDFRSGFSESIVWLAIFITFFESESKAMFDVIFVLATVTFAFINESILNSFCIWLFVL